MDEVVRDRLSRSKAELSERTKEFRDLGRRWASEMATYDQLEILKLKWDSSANGHEPPLGQWFGYEEMAALITRGDMTGREFWTISVGLPPNDPRPHTSLFRTVFANAAVSIFNSFEQP